MQTVFVGLSGGVDSGTAAYLLKKEGYKVVGAFIKGWEPDFLPCTGKEDRLEAMRVAAYLQIPFITYDLEKGYKREVVDYFIAEYKAGRTPNPDVICNRVIKFGAFWEKAKTDGADFVATGHYAQIVAPSGAQSGIVPAGTMFTAPVNREAGSREGANRGEQTTRDHYASIAHGITNYELRISEDKEKDQTYFLWTLKQDDLAHSLFPVGAYEKSEIRKIAERAGLPNARRRDSQGLCFLGHVDMHAFLKRYIPEKRGHVIDRYRRKIGEHDGVWFYTLGQHVAVVGTTKRQYVVSKDVVKNELMVSHTLLGEHPAQTFTLRNLNWISGKPPQGKVLARYRYRQPLLRATFREGAVEFEKPQLIAEGQSCVFYNFEGGVYGGGIIGS